MAGDIWHGHQDALSGVVLTLCARWVALDPLRLSITGQGLNAPQGTRVLSGRAGQEQGSADPKPRALSKSKFG